MRDGCGRNEFAVRVQNHHVRFSFHRNGHYLFLEIVKAAAGLDTLRCRLREGCRCGRLPLHLATGKNTELFGVLDQNENGFFTYVSQRAGSKAATVDHVVTSD